MLKSPKTNEKRTKVKSDHSMLVLGAISFSSGLNMTLKEIAKQRKVSHPWVFLEVVNNYFETK
jgi:hypothetical protein